MKATLLVDAPAVWRAIKADLAAAQRQALFQTYSFEGDSVGEALTDALLASQVEDRRLLIDSYTLANQNDTWLHTPAALLDADLRAEVRNTRRLVRGLRADGVGVRFGRPLGFLGRRLFHRDHKKLVLFDDRVTYLGGVNFSEHNFAWHDIMIRVEHAGLARFLRRDFDASWQGRSLRETRRFGDVGAEIHLLAGAGNPAAMAPIVEVLSEATRSIDVISPYLSPPFTKHLAAAAQRGVRVRVITPQGNNKGYLKRFVVAEAARQGYELRLYQPAMIHMKCMLVDGETLVTGSSNFDLMSYCGFLAEVVAVIRDPGLVAQFRRLVLEPDIRASQRWDPSWGGWTGLRGRLAALPIRVAAGVAWAVRPRRQGN